MKQHISPKQAKEISEEQFYSLFNKNIVERQKDWHTFHRKKVTIGYMIEFLSKTWNLKIEKIYDNEFRVLNNEANGISYIKKELVDALWEAVKYKLKEFGINILEPEVGYLACGYDAEGKLPDNRKISIEIFNIINK